MRSAKELVPNGASGENCLLEQILFLYRSMPYGEYLLTPHWQMIRERALHRASNKCQLCASTTRLEVHHNTYERLGCERPEDVVVICRKCHSKHHNDGMCDAKSNFINRGKDFPVICILPQAHKSPHRHSENLWWVVREGKTIMLNYRDVE